MAKEKEIKQEVYVSSKCLHGNSYMITVKVKGLTTDGRYDYQDNYKFNANKHLTKVECIVCEDGLFLDVATRHAIEHMKKLRSIKKFRFPLFNIFKEEE